MGLLGLARKAGQAEIGEEPVSIAARTHKTRLILLAADASENTLRRGESLGQAGNCPALVTDLTKSELGGAVGRSSCAILALTDTGLAAAAAKKLAQLEPSRYGEAAEKLEQKAEKLHRRQKERRIKEKALQSQRRKPWAAPPAGEKKS